MIKALDDDASSITIGSGNNQVSINIKQPENDQSESLIYPSIVIEMNGMEIEIRRTNQSVTQRSKSVSRIDDYGKKLKVEEKLKPSHTHWDYSSLYGPTMWPRIFPQIQRKRYQSPIRIYTNQCEYEPVLIRYPFIFETDENCCQILENTGHSFQVSGKGYSYITGGPVLDEYQFLQFHMHWGSNENEGSEHVLDGIRYPAELHIVTWNTSKYSTPQEAVASERFGSVLVFGVLIKLISTDNPDMTKLLDLFSRIVYKGDKVNLDSNIVSLRKLMPENLANYYTYDGSLTTPMCYESVRWVVFQETLGLSQNQLNQLRQLKHICKSEKSSSGFIDKNFRPLMPLNGRKVYRSFA